MHAPLRTFYVLLVVICQCHLVDARTWTDKSGKYTVEAEFVSLADGTVKLRRPDGKTVTVPLEKLSEDDQAVARAHLIAETPRPTPNIVLEYDGGTIEIPAASALQLEVSVSHPNFPDEVRYPHVPAIAIKIPGDDRTFVVTALIHFTKNGLPIPSDKLKEQIRGVRIIDGTTGKQVGEVDGVLDPWPASGGEWDFSHDLFVLWTSKPTDIGVLKLAEENPNAGDAAFLMRFPEANPNEPLYRAREPELIALTVRSSGSTRETYVVSHGEKVPMLSGSPILNENGEVLSIHVGRAQDHANRLIALGNPAVGIRERLKSVRARTDAER